MAKYFLLPIIIAVALFGFALTQDSDPANTCLNFLLTNQFYLDGCTNCPGGNTCTVCDEARNFVKTPSNNACLCPSSYYKYSPATDATGDALKKECIACSNYCKVCSQTKAGEKNSNCETCNDGFVGDQAGGCVCSENKWIRTSDNTCQPCATSPKCLTCKDDTHCSTCEPGYFIVSDACSACSTTVPGCTACSTDGKTCNTCSEADFFVLDSGTCKCKAGYFKNSNNKCEICSANCKVCDNLSTCTACNDGYFVNDQKSCSLCSSLTNCDNQCDSGSDYKGICKKCLDTFELTAGKCDCKAGSYNSGTKCVTCVSKYKENCLTCTDTVCRSCATGTYPNQDACSSCSSAIAGCEDCSSTILCNTCKVGLEKIVTSTDTKCGCKDGFFLDTSDDQNIKCSACPTECGKCHENPSSKGKALCENCKTKKYFLNTLFACVVCQTSLTGCDECDSQDVCTLCQTGANFQLDTTTHKCVCPAKFYYSTTDKVCKACEVNCLACSEDLANPTTPKCGNCDVGYIVQNDHCSSCSSLLPGCSACFTDSGVVKCKTCNSPFELNAGQCTCPKGKYLGSDHTCKDCSAAIEKCVECKADTNGPVCTVCESNHFLNQDKACIACDTMIGCLTCATEATSPGKCLTCIASFEGGLNSKGECTCLDGKFKNSVTKLCSTCTSPCNKCTEDKAKLGSSLCDSCDAGYYVTASNTCQKCQGSCATCHWDSANSKEVCDTCQTGWNPQPKDGVCTCPEGKYYDGTSCSACVTKLTSCLSCSPNKDAPTQPLCDKCEVNNFLDDTKKCQLCSSKIDGCYKCSSSSVCTECDSSWNPVNAQGKCDCRDGYFHNTKDHKCQECSAGCVKCVESSKTAGAPECQQCQPGWTIHKVDFSCTRCGGDCKTCSEDSISGKEVCKECKTGFGLDENASCQSCADVAKITNCDSCVKSTKWTCSTCATSYNLVDNTCQACQTLTKDPNCNVCSKNDKGSYICSKCNDAFYLNNGKCESCSEGCKVCTSSTQCTQCNADAQYIFSYPEKASCTKCAKAEEKKGIEYVYDGKTVFPYDICSPASVISDATFNVTYDNSTNRYVANLKEVCSYSKPVGGQAFYIVTTGDALSDDKIKNIITNVRTELKNYYNLTYFDSLTNSSALSYTDVIGGLVYGWSLGLTTAGKVSPSISVPTGNSTIYYICSSKANVQSDSYKTVKVTNVGTVAQPIKLVLSFNKTLNDTERNAATCTVANILKVDKSRVKNSQGRVCNDTPATPPKLRVFMRRLAEAVIEIFTITPNQFEANDTTLNKVESTLPSFQTQFQQAIKFASIDKPQAVRDSGVVVEVPKWKIEYPGVNRDLSALTVSVNLSTSTQSILFYGWGLNTTNVTLDSVRKGVDDKGINLISSGNTVFDAGVEYQIVSPKLQSNNSYKFFYFARALTDESKITNLSTIDFHTYDLPDIQLGYNMTNPSEVPKVTVQDDVYCSIELKLRQNGMLYVGWANASQEVFYESLLNNKDALGNPLVSSENRNVTANSSYTFKSNKLQPKSNYTVYYLGGPLVNETTLYDRTPLYNATCTTTGGNNYSGIMSIFLSLVVLVLTFVLV